MSGFSSEGWRGRTRTSIVEADCGGCVETTGGQEPDLIPKQKFLRPREKHVTGNRGHVPWPVWGPFSGSRARKTHKPSVELVPLASERGRATM